MELIRELKTRLNENFSHYVVLTLILLVGTVAFWFCRYQVTGQIAVAFLTSLAYLVWGVIHHSLSGDFHERVFLEYFSTALFGFMVIWFLLLRV